MCYCDHDMRVLSCYIVMHTSYPFLGTCYLLDLLSRYLTGYCITYMYMKQSVARVGRLL